MILDMNSQLGRFPLFGLPGWLGTLLHTVLPIGLLAYFPALALLKDLGKPTELAFPFLVASLFLTTALICFKKGLSHYAKYSCNRYKEMGHHC